MKVVILAGGLGTRISEESGYKPKPMIEIGNKMCIIDRLLAADGGLHVGDLEVIAKVAVDGLVVGALGQLAELAVKAVAAEVILTGGADAVTAPVAEGEDQAVQQRVVGVYSHPLCKLLIEM